MRRRCRALTLHFCRVCAAKATGQMLSLDDFVIVTVLYSMYGRNDILRLVFNMCVVG